MYDYKMVDPDFNLEKTINENNVLKSNNRALGIILAVVLLSIIGVMIASSIAEKLEEDT
jgi:uncharacterized membrane protein